jgi:hypothetical protein
VGSTGASVGSAAWSQAAMNNEIASSIVTISKSLYFFIFSSPQIRIIHMDGSDDDRNCEK